MNPCESLRLATAPYYREARVTFAWRRTACGMRHCFARRIDGCLGRRKLGCTTTRQAERHPQGVCRIRKASEPPTAAQQRIVGAEANRIATLNAATPRYGQCNRQALQLFELLACNVKTFLLGDLKGDILFCEREYPPLPAPLRVRRDSRFVLTNNISHGMLSAIKAARKKPFLFTRSREGTAGASPCGTEKAALLSRAAEMPRRSLRYKGTKCPASSGEFRWNHGQ